ncbi:MAG: hypothetical protein LBG84_07175 [Treponema sp.]|jgi:hypothetical protein|nr:hypothetical protein [Treponema sp.]
MEDGKWPDASYTLTLSGNTYTDFKVFPNDEFQEPLLEKGTFKRTKTEWIFLPEMGWDWEGKTMEPLSAELKKERTRKVPFSVSGDILEIDGVAYRRGFTGKGAEYTGAMVRGKTRVDITMTIGGFEDGKTVNTFYTQRRTPVKLEGDLAGGVLTLERFGDTVAGTTGDYFYFTKFDPEADAVVGCYWTYYDGMRTLEYDVTLTKKKE